MRHLTTIDKGNNNNVSQPTSLSFSVSLSVYVSLCLSVCLSVCLSLSLALSLYLSLTLSLYLSIPLTLSLSLPPSLSIYLTLSLHLFPSALSLWFFELGMPHVKTSQPGHISFPFLASSGILPHSLYTRVLGFAQENID